MGPVTPGLALSSRLATVQAARLCAPFLWTGALPFQVLVVGTPGFKQRSVFFLTVVLLDDGTANVQTLFGAMGYQSRKQF